MHDTTPDVSAILRPGDRVAVATGFGSGPIQEHTAIDIVVAESDARLLEVPWATLTDRAIVVDLAGGRWAYGCQLSRPTDQPTNRPTE